MGATADLCEKAILAEHLRTLPHVTPSVSPLLYARLLVATGGRVIPTWCAFSGNHKRMVKRWQDLEFGSYREMLWTSPASIV